MEYVTALVGASEELQETENFVRLFDRLNDFYLRWSDGEFMDAPKWNLPQEKMRSLQEQLKMATPLGQRQVDVCVGLNAMKLLTQLHRYARREDQKETLEDKVAFYWCGKARDQAVRSRSGATGDRLFRVSECVDVLGSNCLPGLPPWRRPPWRRPPWRRPQKYQAPRDSVYQRHHLARRFHPSPISLN